MSDWVTYKLSEIFPISMSGEWGSDSIEGNNSRVLRAADFTKDCKLKAEIGVARKIPNEKLGVRILRDGDLLVEKSGGSIDQPVGRVAYFDRVDPDQIYTHSNFLQLLRVEEGFNKKFACYLMAYLYESGLVYRYQQQTTGIFNLKLEHYLNETVSVPASQSVHERIQLILSLLDQAIEKTEALIEKCGQIKAGMMHDLFTRGLTPDGKLRPPRDQAPELYKETPIGWIPKEWEYDLLDKLADRKSGHTPSKSVPEYWNGGVNWVSLADSYRLDKLHIDSTDYEISALGVQNSSAVLLPAGVVIMSRDAGVGKSAITTQPMAVSQHFMAWHCTNKMDNYFLYYWLQFHKRMFENIAMGSTILTIGLPYFKRLKIAAPKEIEEQARIGKRLKDSDIYLFSLGAELKKLRKQKSGLMHDLLTGKVPVNIDHPEAAHV